MGDKAMVPFQGCELVTGFGIPNQNARINKRPSGGQKPAIRRVSEGADPCVRGWRKYQKMTGQNGFLGSVMRIDQSHLPGLVANGQN